jgi:UDP-2,4-diacetamido-2,4,6-trideoxy-beta-L-altropyranose hydrolase
MNIFFRVDSSNIIGTGHIIRCLKMAKYFESYNIFFICKKFQGNLNQKVSENNLKLFELEIENNNSNLNDTNTWLGEDLKLDTIKTINILKKYKVDLLIIDQYAIDFKWQTLVKPYVKKMVLIDDFLERKHNCDFIINGIEEDENKYIDLCNKDCKLLLGPKYFIINKEFFKLAPKKQFNDKIKKICVFISGNDIDNYTYKIMEYLQGKFEDISFDILVGVSNNNKISIQKLCEKNSNFSMYYNIDNVYDIMFNADLCIGSLGQNFIERMVFGIPSIVITLADNQLGFLEKYKDKNIFIYCGHKINDLEKIETSINYLLFDKHFFELKQNCEIIKKILIQNDLKNILKDIL